MEGKTYFPLAFGDENGKIYKRATQIDVIRGLRMALLHMPTRSSHF